MSEHEGRVRVNITVRPETKALIDRLRGKLGVNVSSICDRALSEQLARVEKLLEGKE